MPRNANSPEKLLAGKLNKEADVKAAQAEADIKRLKDRYRYILVQIFLYFQYFFYIN